MLRQDIGEICALAKHIETKEMALNEKEKKLAEAEKISFLSGIPEKQEISQKTQSLFIAIDNLLEKLPDDEIEKFANSEEFKTYKEIIKKIKNGTA